MSNNTVGFFLKKKVVLALCMVFVIGCFSFQHNLLIISLLQSMFLCKQAAHLSDVTSGTTWNELRNEPHLALNVRFFETWIKGTLPQDISLGFSRL